MVGCSNRVRCRTGFTLVEMLVTVSILGIVLAAVCAILMQSIAAHQQTVAEAAMQDKAVRAETQLSRDLLGAYVLFDAAANRLSLVDQNYTDADPRYVSFYVQDGKLYRVAYTSGTPTYDGGELVADSIKSFQFSYYEWYYDADAPADQRYAVIDPIAGLSGDDFLKALNSVHQVGFDITFEVNGYDYTVRKQVRLRNNLRT